MAYIAPQRKLLWHIDRVAQFKNGKQPPPINAEIDLSNRCSLGCEFCHFAYTHTRGPLAGSDKPAGAIPSGDLMDTDLAKSIIKQLSESTVKSVIWTGGGEPTLHPHFNDIIRYSWGKVDQGIYTHGGHIKRDRAALMKEVMTWINISLDAINERDYKAVKRVNRYRDVCKGIERLVKAPGDAIVGVSFMITRSNFWQVSDMKRLARVLGADYVRFRPTIRYRYEQPNKPNENTGWINQAIEYLEKYKDSKFVSVELDRFRMYRDWQEHPYKRCWWSALQVCITPNGKVWTCVNKRENPGAVIGDLSQEQWHEITARMIIPAVDGQCRVMCRGHVANLTLDQVMTKPKHENFI